MKRIRQNQLRVEREIRFLKRIPRGGVPSCEFRVARWYWYGCAVTSHAGIIAHAYSMLVKRVLSFLAWFGKNISPKSGEKVKGREVLDASRIHNNSEDLLTLLQSRMSISLPTQPPGFERTNARG